jgi:hypothetical protein
VCNLRDPVRAGERPLTALEPVLRNFSALIWSLVQVIAKLEENTGPSACP